MPKMNEKQLIEAIRELKEIKPRQEWVSLVKSQILPKKTWSIGNILTYLPQLNYQRKLAYAFAFATLVLIVAGVFGFAQYTVPGDLLFSVKKIAESQDPFQIAYNRSEELVQILKENKTQNIASAVSEFKASISGAAKNLVLSLTQDPRGTPNKKSLKDIAAEVKKIQDNQKQAETLGIDISQTDEAKEYDNALASLVKDQIGDFEKATLTESQQTALEQAKDLYSQQKYSDALEEILLINK